MIEAATRWSAVLAALLLATGLLSRTPAAAETPFADAEDAALVERGKVVYREQCANCHGRNLQGQALWQLADEYAGRRAPALDQSGHGWQHGDDALFRMIADGHFPGTAADARSAMPAFAGRLDDGDILAVMAFIKTRWPLALRVSQAMLNPGFRGMPADADQVDWRLPPTCTTILRARREPATP